MKLTLHFGWAPNAASGLRAYELHWLRGQRDDSFTTLSRSLSLNLVVPAAGAEMRAQLKCVRMYDFLKIIILSEGIYKIVFFLFLLVLLLGGWCTIWQRAHSIDAIRTARSKNENGNRAKYQSSAISCTGCEWWTMYYVARARKCFRAITAIALC